MYGMGKATDASITAIESWQGFGCVREDGEQNSSEKGENSFQCYGTITS